MKSKHVQKNQANFTNEFWFDHFKEKRSQIYSFLRPKHYYQRAMTYWTYPTRAIITRGLYIFYLIFYCGLYSREVNVTDSLCTKKR